MQQQMFWAGWPPRENNSTASRAADGERRAEASRGWGGSAGLAAILLRGLGRPESSRSSREAARTWVPDLSWRVERCSYAKGRASGCGFWPSHLCKDLRARTILLTTLKQRHTESGVPNETGSCPTGQQATKTSGGRLISGATFQPRHHLRQKRPAQGCSHPHVLVQLLENLLLPSGTSVQVNWLLDWPRGLASPGPGAFLRPMASHTARKVQ